jgi:hypothetical protein
MFEYFYHEVFRRTIIAFGSIFNNISVKHTDSSGEVQSVIKVPLAYGPTQKFLARLEQSPDPSKPVQMTLPRMSFEMTGIQYDAQRKVTTTQTFTSKSVDDGTITKKAYMPVPYNMNFELSIMSKLNDDVLQIVEQIIPYFQPAYNITISLLNDVNEKRDIPIVLENITMQDDYEGDFTTRRVIYYTLRFTAKTYLFGPITTATKDIIKKSTISISSGEVSGSTKREVVYSSEARATKNYTGIVLTNLAKDITTTDTLIEVNNSSSISVNTYLDIEGEEVYVKLKTGNVLTVQRGKDNTSITSHLAGAEIKSITQADNLLIQEGDNFGFTGDIT